jgi:hypothetical protein
MRELVVYGLGELGQLYGAAALRAGLRVTPITRASDPERVLSNCSPEAPILIAVGERALPDVLAGLGVRAANRVVLLQNELFPSQYRGLSAHPTVLVPWLLKKPGMPLLVARPTPVFGPFAELVSELHRAIEVPSLVLSSERELHQALVDKYAFILTINALGVLRDRTLAVWLQEDPRTVEALAQEATELGARLCESDIDPAQAKRAVTEGMRALGTISARGRTAPERVARAREQAAHLGLQLPELARVAATL